jgi:hypothetical protein
VRRRTVCHECKSTAVSLPYRPLWSPLPREKRRKSTAPVESPTLLVP